MRGCDGFTGAAVDQASVRGDAGVPVVGVGFDPDLNEFHVPPNEVAIARTDREILASER